MGKERQKREIDDIVRELKIIREQLKHPNIVRYYSTFQESKSFWLLTSKRILVFTDFFVT